MATVHLKPARSRRWDGDQGEVVSHRGPHGWSLTLSGDGTCSTFCLRQAQRSSWRDPTAVITPVGVIFNFDRCIAWESPQNPHTQRVNGADRLPVSSKTHDPRWASASASRWGRWQTGLDLVRGWSASPDGWLVPWDNRGSLKQQLWIRCNYNSPKTAIRKWQRAQVKNVMTFCAGGWSGNIVQVAKLKSGGGRGSEEAAVRPLGIDRKWLGEGDDTQWWRDRPVGWGRQVLTEQMKDRLVGGGTSAIQGSRRGLTCRGVVHHRGIKWPQPPTWLADCASGNTEFNEFMSIIGW